MPLLKPYPPTEIDHEDWNDLAENYCGKVVTLIVNVLTIFINGECITFRFNKKTYIIIDN
jgi:hypothetical protein